MTLSLTRELSILSVTGTPPTILPSIPKVITSPTGFLPGSMEPRNRQLPRARLVSKVVARLKMNWGREGDASQIERAIETVLADLKA